MTEHTGLTQAFPWSVDETRAAVRAGRQKLLDHLDRYGIIEPALKVCCLRRPLRGRLGYYTSLSQFRGAARINVDPLTIWRSLADDGEASLALLQGEVEATIFHEYGHVIAECIRWCLDSDKPLEMTDWRPVFGSVEEDFAEDFARFLQGRHAQDEFWIEFLPAYGTETRTRFYS